MSAEGERRVAATPETVKKFIALGASVAVESGAGLTASIADADYAAAGASVADRAATLPTTARLHAPIAMAAEPSHFVELREFEARLSRLAALGDDALRGTLSPDEPETLPLSTLPSLTRSLVRSRQASSMTIRDASRSHLASRA